MTESADTALRNHLASLFGGDTTDTVTQLCLGNDSGWYSSDGLGVVTASTIEYLNTTAYPFTLHLSKTFTNSGTDEHQITKIGVYDSNASPNLLHTYEISQNEIPNFGYIPPGESIDVDVYIIIAENMSHMYFDESSNGFKLTYVITAMVNISLDLDPAKFTPTKIIDYNGIELPSPHINNYGENLGAKSWNIRCYTTDLDLIDQIIRYASPIKTGAAVSGYQYVISPYRSGVLSIRDIGGITYTQHERCFISGPITIEPFGTGYFFNVNIIQSYFEDQT